MSVKWTEEQRQVIELRDCNILVSAAAGSGKTAVLVERILSMLTDEQDPTDIDRLLIVTFTNAAAGEMRDRIRAAIEQRIEALEQAGETDSALLEHLQRQTSLLSNAQIATIHSFCQYVIRSHFHTIDLDPGLRVADEGEQKLLRNDVLEKLLEEKYAQGEEAFLYMTECMAPGRDDKAMAEAVLSLYEFSRSFPWPEEWFRECLENYGTQDEASLERTSWIKALMSQLRTILLDAEEQIRTAMEAAQDEDGPYFYLPALREDEAFLEELLQETTYAGLGERIREAGSWARLSAKKDPAVSNQKKEQIKAIREEYKKTVAKIREDYFSQTPRVLLEELHGAEPVVRELIRLTEEFAERFLQEKQKKNLMDFNDLEHYALEILIQKEDGRICPTPVAREFSRHYREIMIDEYQDSNLAQEMILGSISRLPDGIRNMFMVGDVKQSIYRFRLARPELFMEKFRTYSLTEGDCRRIDLHKNFRSRREVLQGVNFLFEQIMGEQLGGVEYDEAAALYPGAVFEPGDDENFRKTEVLLLDADSLKEETQEKEAGKGEKEETAREERDAQEETVRELEARAVAGRIRDMVGRERIWDKESRSYRPVRWGDIVILLRTIQGWADVFAGVLSDMDIPVLTGSRTGYFSALEVQTVLSYLSLIDNPRQDIPMAAVVHSPIGGLSAKEMARIRSEHPEQPFYEACMEESSLKGFFELLEEFRDMAKDTPIHELLQAVLERTGYGVYAAAMPGGSQRKANLDMLVEKAIAYETGSYRGLYHFIRYINNLHKYDVDYGEAPDVASQDAVHILSIHKSKGLEFPVVFVCGMGKTMNQSDARSSVIMHAQFGMGCDYVDPIRRVRRATLLKNMMKRQTVLENLGEEQRVLYVALTRAKEKLILTGAVSGLEEKLERWSRVLSRQETALSFTDRAKAATYWDWIVPALIRNRCFDEICREREWTADRSHPLYSREACLEVRLVGAEELTRRETVRQADYQIGRSQLWAADPQQVENAEVRDLLEERLAFSYDKGQGFGIPSKFSVSELKRLSQEELHGESRVLYEAAAPAPLIPEFLNTKTEVSGAARGTIYHKLMECLNFSLFSGQEELEGLLDQEILRVIRDGYLTGQEAELIRREKILVFLKNPLAGRMFRAAQEGKLFRERQFVLEVAAERMNPAWAGEEPIMIQGIIDAYFVEEDAIVLVDYKTDFVKMQEASSLYEKYRVQLEYYEMALERLTGIPVKEKLIYSFCLDRVLAGEEAG